MELDPDCFLNITSNHSIFSCLRIQELDYRGIFLGISLSLVALATIGGNILIMLTVALVDKLRTPCNLLIVNLALTDFLVGVIVMPFTIVHQITLVWPFGTTLCMLYISTDVILCTSSILCLCAISIDRYFSITRPFDYTNKRTPGLMFLMIFIGWFFSFAISIPPIFTWTFSYEDGASLSCQYASDFYYQLYATVIAFYLPLIIMLILYGRIFVLARRMAFKDTRVKHNNGINQYDKKEDVLKINSAVTEVQSQEIFKNDNGTNSDTSTSNKAVLTLGVILGCFTVCWFPFFLTQLATAIYQFVVSDKDAVLINATIQQIFLWLGYFNSFFNPIIYAKFNKEFRTPFIFILKCKCREINDHMRREHFEQQYGTIAKNSFTRKKRSKSQFQKSTCTKNESVLNFSNTWSIRIDHTPYLHLTEGNPLLPANRKLLKVAINNKQNDFDDSVRNGYTVSSNLMEAMLYLDHSNIQFMDYDETI